MKRNILLLGAGKSSGSLIRYFSERSAAADWQLTVADVSEEQALEKASGLQGISAICLDFHDVERRREAIAKSALVISLLPPHFHATVARDCIELGVHMATASYVSPEMQSLHDDAVQRGLILLNECGLDPGLDHMSAMELIDNLKEKGARILSFKSFTGGLVAPESNDNPWGYKFSWNPRNVILAGQGTAKYMDKGRAHFIPYHRLFSEAMEVAVTDASGSTLLFDGYANRDSLSYRRTYGLESVPTLLRGTLRQKNFCRAWNAFVQLGLTDDSYVLDNSERLTYAEWVAACLPAALPGSNLETRLCAFLGLDPATDIFRMIEWTGLLSDEPIGLAGATPAQALQHLLEKKWKLHSTDRDMIVMQHEIRYQEQSSENEFEVRASLVLKGTDAADTAMARTVGLPLAMASRLILENKITKRGCLVPVFPELYVPLLAELKSAGIGFYETHHAVSMSL